MESETRVLAVAKRLLREPLLHFVVAGGLLFLASSALSPSVAGTSSARTVHLTTGQVSWLRESWTRQWQRPPSEDELRGLVSAYLRERLLASEALELGLDQDDTVVRRRLAQKMEFLLEDTARLAAPSDAELHRLYDEHPERFRSEPLVSFEQVFFSVDSRGERAAEDARRFLADLASSGAQAAAGVGDPLLLDTAYQLQSRQSIAGLLGDAFADRLFAIEERGRWLGPIESSYGVHLVRVSERVEPVSDFAAARSKVEEEWRRLKLERAREDTYATLLAKYHIEVDDELRSLVGPIEARAGRDL